VAALSIGAMETQPHLVKVPYDPVKDIAPIMQYAEYPQGIAVKADSPLKTFKDLIDYARANPGKVTYGTVGTGSAQHLMMERIAMVTGVKWSHVPFKGGNPAVTALLGGHITATTVAEFVPQVKSGTMRLLATTNVNRLSDFPDVPTVQESGYPGLYMVNYVAIGAPAGTPKDRMEKLNKAFKNAMNHPTFKEVMNKWSFEVSYRPGDEVAKIIREGFKVHGELIKKMGMKGE